MSRTTQALITLTATLAIVVFIQPFSAVAHRTQASVGKSAKALLWSEPTDLASRKLLYGPGGQEHAPSGTFTFIEEDHGGYNPKFTVRDQQGRKWKVKLGPEAKSETAATRLVWAAGYFADEDYFVPELRVEQMKKLSRGEEFVSPDGTVRGARLELHKADEKKIGDWSWFENPFIGSRELNGLKVMMALINNWDLKTENNAVYEGPDGTRRYVVSDLGASFGRTGSISTRSRSNLQDYVRSEFIEKIRPAEVDFVLDTRPFFLLAINFPWYNERSEMEKIVKHIPRSDARWIGTLLAGLSNEQLSDAFRAAGYTQQEAELYTQQLRYRITQLTKL
ncbi:MAG TPA: hypothetical protein VNQ79_07900 [Blastocatellia bacterium]|nr:hypothetical protein [Blastocatellia bacterium]